MPSRTRSQNNIKMPSARSMSGRPLKYDFTSLRQSGDAILVTLPVKRRVRKVRANIVRSCAASYGTRHGFDVATRYVMHPETKKLVIGVWRL